MYKDIKIALIVAFDKVTRSIGKDNKLLWHIPEDLKFFKQKTLNHAVIAGRKTFASIGKALPNRHNIALSRRGGCDGMRGICYCDSLELALESAWCYSRERDLSVIFVIGGGEIYRQFMSYADILYVTEVSFKNGVIEGDVFFPEIAGGDWFRRVIGEGSDDRLSWQFIEYCKV